MQVQSLMFGPQYWNFSQWLSQYLEVFHQQEDEFSGPDLSAEIMDKKILPMKFSITQQLEAAEYHHVRVMVERTLKSKGFFGYQTTPAPVTDETPDDVAADPEQPRYMYARMDALDPADFLAAWRNNASRGPGADLRKMFAQLQEFIAIHGLQDQWDPKQIMRDYTDSLYRQATG